MRSSSGANERVSSGSKAVADEADVRERVPVELLQLVVRKQRVGDLVLQDREIDLVL
jgi:hypothetical protein